MGDRSHKPTEETRRTAELMSGYGLTRKVICAHLQITEKTLLKHYEPELAKGDAKAKISIGQALFTQAVGRAAEYDERGNLLKEEMKPRTASTIFLARVRLGMKPTEKVEVSGSVAHTHAMVHVDLSRLTDAEAADFRRLYAKAVTGPATPDQLPADTSPEAVRARTLGGAS